MTAQHTADLEPARRTAILVAQVVHLDTRVADAILAMFEKYIGSPFTKARSGPAERRLYETAVLAALRDRLRGADIRVASSRDYRASEDYLLPPNGQEVTGGIGGETDPARYVAARAGLLHEQLTYVASRPARQELDGVEIEEGRLYIARTRPVTPPRAC